jgi:hypothetical protein
VGILGNLRVNATSITAGRPLEGVARWSVSIPGFAAHPGRIHGPSNSLFLADGWGVSHSSVRFRRFDLASGQEIASIRTGTAIRCFAVIADGAELVGASDSKLFRLGLDRLDERQRWGQRIPRYADSIVVRDGIALVANWMATSLSLVDLATDRVRRREAPEMMLVIDGAADVLLVGGSKAGGLAAIDPRSAEVRSIRETPPAIEAALSHDGQALWTTVGVRGEYTRSASGGTSAPGRPTRRLRREWLDGREQPAEYELPAAVGPLVFGRTELWLAGPRSLVALPLPVGSGPGRVWNAPDGHLIEWFDPDVRLAIVVQRAVPDGAATATATAFGLS